MSDLPVAGTRTALRLAVSGASSTGKTTLIRALRETGVLSQYRLRVLAIDERAILREMGCRDTGCMTADLLRAFQLRLLEEKVRLERGQVGYLCEHSYVDMAAYWTVRDWTQEDKGEDMLVSRCRQMAADYDLHIVLPFGAIPFEADGYRSRDLDLHRRVASRIDVLLEEWNVRHVMLSQCELARRVEEVQLILGALQSARQSGA